MRIIAGQHRGLILESPPGSTIRPTADRVRESVFNIIDHRFQGDYPAWPQARFLDLCCGTGAVGLEAASRGAREVLMVDHSDLAAKVVAKNMRRFSSGVRFVRGDVKAMPRTSQPFDYVFMDPPYTDFALMPALNALIRQGYIGPQTLVIVEQPKAMDPPQPLQALFSVLDDRRYGSSRVFFLALLPPMNEIEPNAATIESNSD
jgi:16S rRNA (guanine966-N2)-methyltransferase